MPPRCARRRCVSRDSWRCPPESLPRVEGERRCRRRVSPDVGRRVRNVSADEHFPIAVEFFPGDRHTHERPAPGGAWNAGRSTCVVHTRSGESQNFRLMTLEVMSTLCLAADRLFAHPRASRHRGCAYWPGGDPIRETPRFATPLSRTGTAPRRLCQARLWLHRRGDDTRLIGAGRGTGR